MAVAQGNHREQHSVDGGLSPQRDA